VEKEPLSGDVRNNHEHEANHEDAALAQLVGVPAGANTEDASHDVGGYRHQLRHLGGTGGAEVVDDGRQEKRVRVKARVNADSDKQCTMIFQSLMTSQKYLMSNSSASEDRSRFRRA
jgi:hypothetical protein